MYAAFVALVVDASTLATSTLTINGNVLTYNLQAVSDEEPGTYTASVWVILKDDSTLNLCAIACVYLSATQLLKV